MLLAAALVVPILGKDIMDVDEATTMINACWRHLGPCTPAEAVERRAWPLYGWGLTIFYSLWGQLVGWSEFALRALIWSSGLLTIAWLYRLGRDLYSPKIAFFAALLLSTSVLFLVYMNNIRAYGPALLCTTMVLWGYWRVALDRNPAGRGAQWVLLAGVAGLLYTVAFAYLLLPALGLFHLFFVRRDRRWWQTLVAPALALLLALPQLPEFAMMLQRASNHVRDSYLPGTLHAPEALSLLLRHLSNDLINPHHPAAALLFLVLPLLPATDQLRKRRSIQWTDATPWLVMTTLLLLVFHLALNEWGRLLHPTTVRYLSTLWPPAMLLIAVALLHPTRAALRKALGTLCILAVAVFGAFEFAREGPLIQATWYWRKVFPTADMNRIAQDLGESPENLLVVQEWFFGASRQRDIYTGDLVSDTLSLAPETTSADILEQSRGNHELTFLLRSSREDSLRLQDHVDFLLQRHWLPHDVWRANDVTFMRFVTPFSTLLIEPHALEFDRGIRITGSGILPEQDKLRFITHIRSDDASLPASYSLAVHVIDSGSAERVAQADSGVGEGTYVRKITDIDLGALPPGAYELQVGLYNWQTGEPLMARDPETGVVSDVHVLRRFRKS